VSRSGTITRIFPERGMIVVRRILAPSAAIAAIVGISAPQRSETERDQAHAAAGDEHDLHFVSRSFRVRAGR
jgi:hypothetical protein